MSRIFQLIHHIEKNFNVSYKLRFFRQSCFLVILVKNLRNFYETSSYRILEILHSENFISFHRKLINSKDFFWRPFCFSFQLRFFIYFHHVCERFFCWICGFGIKRILSRWSCELNTISFRLPLIVKKLF